MGTRTVSVLTLLALSLNATAAIAAEPASQPFGDRDMESQVDLSQVYQPEAVYVTSVAASVAKDNVTGSFVIENAEDALVTGLQYRIEMRGIGDEEGLPYAIDVVRASVALAPYESKKLLFATPLANVPAGRYDLRVQLLTAKGRSLGWQETPVVIDAANASANFVKIVPGTIGIAAYGDELLPPLSGPNVDPSSALTLRATAINSTDHDIRVTPTVEIFDFNAARVGLATFEYSDLNVAAGESVKLDMPITSEASAGTYMAHVTLKDAETGETISSIAQYRFVVKGEDADIVAVRISDMGTTAGDWAYGTVDIAGSADALRATVATLRIQIMDDQGVVGSIDVPGIELTDAILSANIRIPLERDLVGSPTVDASLLSSSNATFDHVTYAGTLTPAQLASITGNNSFLNWIGWHGVSRVALFAFVAIALGYALYTVSARMRGNVAFTRVAIAAFLLVCFSTQIASAGAVGSGGIETLTPKNGSSVFAPLGNRPIIALFINSPVHGQANNFCNRQIQLSYRLEYGVCENEIAYARVLGRVTRDGGHISSYDVPGTQWETVHNRTYQSQFCSDHFCFQTETFNGTIDLTNVVDPGASTATLQLLAKWGKNIAMPDTSFDRGDTFIQLGWAHAMNVHLQCTPPQLNVSKTVQSGSAIPGSNVVYSFTVSNTGQSNATNVTINDFFLSGNNRYMPFEFVGSNGASCSFDSGAVQTSCNVGTLTPGQTKTFTMTFRVPQNQPQLCGQTVRNRVEARPNNQSTGSASAEAQVNIVCPPQYGCVEVFKEGFDANNQRITGPLPAFQFKLDGQIDTMSNAQGFARFDNVQPGTHSVQELAANGWENFLVTPPNGQVVVQAGNNCAGVTFKNRQLPQDADLQIQKSGPTAVVRGNTASYSLIVKNNGPASATNVIVGDPLPAGTTFVAAQSDNRCTLQGNNVFCNLGTMQPNAQIALSITLDVPNSNPQTCQPGSIVNRASVLSDRQDRNLQNNESSFTTQVSCPQPQFGCVDVFKEGFDVNNQRITSPLPNFTFKLDNNQTITTDPSGNARFSNVTPGQHTVTEVALNGWTLFNTTPANGTVNVLPGNTCVGVVFKNRQVPQDADLRVIKTGPATVVRGQNAVYQIAVKNLGPATATNVIVGDPLPAGTTFVAAQSDNRCTLQGSNVFCTVGTLAANQETTITLTLAVTLPQQCTAGSIVNRASVLADQQDRTLSNNESQVTTQATCPQPQVGCIDVFKEGFNAAGSRLGTVPPFKFILDGSGSVFVHTNSNGNARFSNVPVGQHTVTEVTASGWTLFNTTPTGGIVQVQPGNACAGVVFKNRQQPQNADVSIVKAGPATAVRGGNLTYSLTVTNTGPATAQNVVVDDQLPSGLTNPVVSGQGCTINNGAVRCVIGPMQPGEQRIITINMQVPSVVNCQPGSVTNTGTVTVQNDNQAGNNSSSVTTQLQCPQPQQADLQIQKSGPTSVVRGQNASYTLIVKNNGPAASPNTIVGDPLPAGTTFIAAQSDNRCTLQGNNVFCTLGTMAVNAQTSIQITLNMTAQQQCQTGTVLNRAGVVGDLQDPNMANNESTFTTQVSCPQPQNADVSVAKTGPTSVQRGSNITYQLVVSNAGPATASGVVLTDAVPSGLTLVSAGTGCTLTNSTISCAVGALASSASKTYAFTFSTGTVPQNCTNGTVTNTGIVTSTTTDPNSQNNQSSVTTTLTCPQPNTADVSVAKTGPTTVVRGSSITYNLVVTNAGPATASGVVLTDAVPANLMYVTSGGQGTCQLINGTVTCQIGTIPANQTRTVTLTFSTVAATTPCTLGTVTNTGIVTSTTTDPNGQNNQSSANTELTCPVTQGKDVSIAKTGPSIVTRGDNFTYTLTVTNAGPATATGVIVTDVIPSGLTFVTTSPECANVAGTVTCQAGTIAAGQSRTFTITVNAPSIAQCSQSSVTNTGTVTSSGTDSNTANNSSSLTTQINCPNAQVGCIDVIKETFDSNGNILTPVTQFTFSLDGIRTAVNGSDGRARFENVSVGAHTVTETIPNGWTQQLVTPVNGSVNVVAGACATVTFKNRQTGTTGGWSITKTDHETEVEQGDTLEYEIRVRNLSSIRQTNVTIIDTLPDEVDFQDASPNESSENGRTIRWENQTFEANEERTYRVEVEVDDDADGTLYNTAEVQGITATDRTDVEDDDDDDDDNDDDVEIDLTKTASTSEVFPGGIIDYTVRVRNRGDDTIENLSIVDNLPADVIVIDDGDADSRSGRRLEWEFDDLDENDEIVLRYRVSVPTYMVAGQIIRNNVCVGADDLDDLECESVSVSVLGIIPRTGARTTTPQNTHLTPVAKRGTPSDGSLPFLTMIALAGAATGAGLGFGRKMLFGI